MALHLNLLHEEILEQRLRQRDPLKIGMLVLAGIGALMFIWYMGKDYQNLSIRYHTTKIHFRSPILSRSASVCYPESGHSCSSCTWSKPIKLSQSETNTTQTSRTGTRSNQK